jgi:hypothetical protein
MFQLVQTPLTNLDGSIGRAPGQWHSLCPYESISSNDIRTENGSQNILAEGELLDGSLCGGSSRPARVHPGIIPLHGEGRGSNFFLFGRLLLSCMVSASDLGRPETGGPKGTSYAHSLCPSGRLGGGGNFHRRLYGAILHCQASIPYPSGSSSPPVHLQLLSSPPYLSQMVAPASVR